VTNEERTNIKVGLTVLAGIAVLLFGIGWAKGWHTAGHDVKYRALFANSGGVEPGDPVYLNGVKRGTVETVDLHPTDVLVTMLFSDPIDLRSDATATITILELMGGKKIELRQGTSTQPFPPSAIIPGTFGGDFGSMVEMVTGLSTSIHSIAQRADTLLASLNSITHGDTLKTKLFQTFDKADKALTHVDDAASRASALLAENRVAITQTINDADSALHTLSSIAKENRVGLRVFIDSGTRAIADARLTLSRLDSMLVKGEQNNSLLYRLTSDRGFAIRIDSVVESLTKLSEQLRLQGLDANIRFWNSAKPAK
jgi:phospholipid/cholesterol/gamma-HCH transport system substrate-binding protein